MNLVSLAAAIITLVCSCHDSGIGGGGDDCVGRWQAVFFSSHDILTLHFGP